MIRLSATDGNQELRSVHSTTLPILLEHCGISLVISTYQANKLIVARTDRGQLNTHFCPFDRSMGMAHHGGKTEAIAALERVAQNDPHHIAVCSLG